MVYNTSMISHKLDEKSFKVILEEEMGREDEKNNINDQK
jgi:hypothetical protein